MKNRIAFLTVIAALTVPLCSWPQSARVELGKVDWQKPTLISKTTATLQVVVNPPLRPGSPIHDRMYSELKALGADYVRYVPWLPYPKLGVAELQPPADGKTSWDFSVIDPMTIDFLNATAGHPVVLNFSTIPAWLFKTDKPVEYPADPNQVTWSYTKGTELRDPSLKELGDYFARLVSWYVNGGFTDEYGKRHESGHHFNIPYWEVLNEVDYEHNMTPEQYTARYDAIVSAIHQVAPSMKFVGLALAAPTANPDMFEYFLNPGNHRSGTPLDMISYHFYATPAPDETAAIQPYTFFAQADGFLTGVRYIEEIRKRLSPATATTIDEIGCISADDSAQGQPGHVTQPIPNSYWNLCGATFAYVFGHLAESGIEIAGESQLLGYPTQFPSVSLVDWNTGAPNARFRTLQLLKDSFHPGDSLFKVDSHSPYVYALASRTPQGTRKLLLVNKRDRDIAITLPQPAKSLLHVTQTSAGEPPQTGTASEGAVTLSGYEVAVVTLQ